MGFFLKVVVNRFPSNDKQADDKKGEDSPKVDQRQQQTPPPKHDDLFEMPIPLPNKRKAYLHYPLDNLTLKDIKVIRKAIDFIASSLEDEEIENKEA